MIRNALITADELLRLNLPNKRTELVNGQLVVREFCGYQHGETAARMAAAIATYAYARRMGRVFAAGTGFQLRAGPDTVLAADVAFVCAARVPEQLPDGYAKLAPDLVVEVLSPGDAPDEVRERITTWLGAGTTLVWAIEPVKKTARVYRADGTESAVTVDGALDGESVLAGFSCELASIF